MLIAVAACARPPQRQVRVVVSGSGRLARASGFVSQLNDYQLKNVKVVVCDAAGNGGRLARCASGGPALFVTVGGVETKTVMQAGGGTPVIYVGIAASLDWGYVKKLSRPGGRASGVDNNYAELSGKRLQLLKTALPTLDRVLVVYQPSVVPTPRGLDYLRRAARVLRVKLGYFPVEKPADIDALGGALDAGGEQAVFLMPSFVIENSFDKIVRAADDAGIPVVGLHAAQVKQGAFLAYGADGAAMGRQAARMARQVLLGYPVAEMPVERPLQTSFSLNLKVARRLGLRLEPRALDLAQEVVR